MVFGASLSCPGDNQESASRKSLRFQDIPVRYTRTEIPRVGRSWVVSGWHWSGTPNALPLLLVISTISCVPVNWTRPAQSGPVPPSDNAVNANAGPEAIGKFLIDTSIL